MVWFVGLPVPDRSDTAMSVVVRAATRCFYAAIIAEMRREGNRDSRKNLSGI
jgi:hypothetical protein